MTKVQIALIIATIILFIIGLWPVAFLTLFGFVAIAISKYEEKKQAERNEMEELKKRIEQLEKDR